MLGYHRFWKRRGSGEYVKHLGGPMRQGWLGRARVKVVSESAGAWNVCVVAAAASPRECLPSARRVGDAPMLLRCRRRALLRSTARGH